MLKITNKTQKELAAELSAFDSKTFETLHKNFYFDFCEDFTLIKHNGRFTLNSLYKWLDSMGVSADAKTVLLVKHGGQIKRIHVAVLRRGRIDIEIDGHGYLIESRKLDFFCRKADFEEARKDDDTELYVIAQSAEHLKKPTPHKFDYYNRMLVKRDEGYWGVHIYEQGYPARIEYINRTSVDKSGYNLDSYRSALYNRVEQYKAKKKKREYLALDYTANVEELRVLISTAKAILLSAFSAANTYKELDKVDDAMSRWGGFVSAVGDFERFEERTKEKDFPSKAVADSYYEGIKKKVLEVIRNKDLAALSENAA